MNCACVNLCMGGGKCDNRAEDRMGVFSLSKRLLNTFTGDLWVLAKK